MKRGDVIVLLLALGVLAGLYANRWHSDAPPADTLRVFVNAEPYADYPLGENRRLEIPGARGISEIAIEDGAARFTASPCSGKFCIHFGWLRGSGAAACLPNRVSIQVIGHERRFDSVNF